MSVSLLMHYAMGAYGGMEECLSNRCTWMVSFMSRMLYRRKEPPGGYWTADRVDPKDYVSKMMDRIFYAFPPPPQLSGYPARRPSRYWASLVASRACHWSNHFRLIILRLLYTEISLLSQQEYSSRFEVSSTVCQKVVAFWEVTACSFCRSLLAFVRNLLPHFAKRNTVPDLRFPRRCVWRLLPSGKWWGVVL
jgi:hypothetical protein